MRKIQKVIEDCLECEFCRKFETQRDNYTHVFVCVMQKDETYPHAEPFLLDYKTSSGMNALPIPKNCPLEDYTGTQTEH